MTTIARPLVTGVYAIDRFSREVSAARRPAYVRAPYTGDRELDTFMRSVAEAMKSTAPCVLRPVCTGREDVNRWSRELARMFA